ncbi:MAG TPA: hypothetical protein VLB44_01355, partial [Kofleriaceae bacterium]|nr:hypothetical protein [Kofleriaceae bacterium]
MSRLCELLCVTPAERIAMLEYWHRGHRELDSHVRARRVIHAFHSGEILLEDARFLLAEWRVEAFVDLEGHHTATLVDNARVVEQYLDAHADRSLLVLDRISFHEAVAR